MFDRRPYIAVHLSFTLHRHRQLGFTFAPNLVILPWGADAVRVSNSLDPPCTRTARSNGQVRRKSATKSGRWQDRRGGRATVRPGYSRRSMQPVVSISSPVSTCRYNPSGQEKVAVMVRLSSGSQEFRDSL
jgi:hypothetical protein